jgi:dephospho-CoA kinase
MAGSGKSIASQFFRSKGHPVLRFGDQTDIGLAEAGLPVTEENEKQYRERIRSELGMEAMAIKIVPRIEKAASDASLIVLDGLYSWEEYIYLKQKYPQLTLLCIYASPDVRYARLKTRTVRPLSEEEAKSRDRAEIENLHKGGPIAMADMLLINDGGTDALIAKLDALYPSLI